jgi:large subunit ribosomal protein L5
MKTPSVKTLYTEKAVPALSKELGIVNSMAMPRIAKVVVNVGIGKVLKDQKRVDEIVVSLEAITGQKVLLTKARKAIAGFKIREDLEVGARTTLHGKRMWDFLDRLFMIALPRVRDFQGVAIGAVDQSGNLNLGIKDHTIFSEIVPEKVQHIFSFQVTVVTTAKNREEGKALFRALGVPFQQNDTNDK